MLVFRTSTNCPTVGVTVTTAVTTNIPRCVLKWILVQISGVEALKTCIFHVLHTCWTAVTLISHPFCDGGE
jgi:hypothetical protein